MNRREILDRERRWARPAAFAAIAATPLYFASVFIQNASVAAAFPTEQLRSVAENETGILISAFLGGISLGLIAIPLLYLFKAAQARSDRVSGAMVGFPILAGLLLLAQYVLNGFTNVDLASQFVDQAAAGGDIYNLQEDLAQDSTLLGITQSLALPAFLAVIVAVVYVALNSMRVGLLTRFTGSLGMALGFGVILFPFLGLPFPALMGITLWITYIGFVILGRVPRGRPPAWETGEAMPWLAPGQEAPANRAEDDVVEGDADEVLGEDEDAKDHSARRERAKKRKRKRRQ